MLNLSNLSSKFLFSRHIDFHEVACSQDVPSIIAVGVVGRQCKTVFWPGAIVARLGLADTNDRLPA